MGTEVKGLITLSCEIFEKGLNREFADRDLAAHAGVDVMSLESRTVMEVADPMEFTAAVLVLERVGARVEGTEHNIVSRFFVGGVGQVHVPKGALARRPQEENLECLGGALGGRGPVGLSMLPDLLGDRDRGKSEDCRFASGGCGS